MKRKNTVHAKVRLSGSCGAISMWLAIRFAGNVEAIF